jgi:hypothetical protein
MIELSCCCGPLGVRMQPLFPARHSADSTSRVRGCVQGGKNSSAFRRTAATDVAAAASGHADAAPSGQLAEVPDHSTTLHGVGWGRVGWDGVGWWWGGVGWGGVRVGWGGVGFVVAWGWRRGGRGTSLHHPLIVRGKVRLHVFLLSMLCETCRGPMALHCMWGLPGKMPGAFGMAC